jgi:hypothetical protein
VRSGFGRDDHEIYALLADNAMYGDNPLPTFRDNPSVPSSRAKKTFWSLKMGQRGYTETSVKDCHCTLRKIPEERSSHSHRPYSSADTCHGTYRKSTQVPYFLWYSNETSSHQTLLVCVYVNMNVIAV